MNNATWLSVGAETLLRELEGRRHQDADCDVLIVGSGYGGAVAAARLAGCTVAGAAGARRPAEIWVVERGREYLRGMFASRFAELPSHVRFSRQDGAPPRGYAEALFDLRLGDDCHVLLGSGLGGGSLINAGVMERPAEDVWAQGWPDTLDRQAVDKGYAAALAMLTPQKAPELPKFAALQRLAKHAGAQADLCGVAVHFGDAAVNSAGVTMQPCTLCGDCMTGCNQGAKATLDTNYLAYAAARKVQMFCGATVEKLVAPVAAGAPWRVEWHHSESGLRPRDGAPYAIRARRVVLAAGALGSTEILLRSRSEGLRFSPKLGRRFSGNGDLVAGIIRHADEVNATADQESDPADPRVRGVGPTITGLVRTGNAERRFAVEEFAVPGALARVFGEVMATFGVWADAPAADGQDPLAAGGRAISHSGLYGCMGDDGAHGAIELAQPARGIDAGVRIAWPELKNHPLFDDQMAWLRAACTGEEGAYVVANPAWRLLPNELKAVLEAGAAATVHPLGGCAMGPSAADGVVDHWGRVFAADGRLHDGLAVLDGAIVPRALGINPALTIAALAEQAVPGLRDDWGLKSADEPGKRDLAGRPVWSGARGPVARGPTKVQVRETLQGRLHISNRFYWATLKLTLEPIDDLWAFVLQNIERKVPVDTATLTLHDAAADSDEFNLRDIADEAPLLRADLTGTVALFVQPEDDWRELHYEFVVGPVHEGSALQPGQALRGRKRFPRRGSIWGQLSELALWIDTEPDDSDDYVAPPPAGRLCLALDALARERHPLLTVLRQSSAPDALADLAALALYLLRIQLRHKFEGLVPHDDYDDALIAANLGERLPGVLDGQAPEVLRVGPHGARLSRYAPTGDAGGRPVLLIHGYGASGSSFAHPAIGINLVRFLLREGREAWVLDLRTSIGNEPDDPAQPRGGPWTFDEVAHEDIPAALAIVAAQTRAERVDVIAHCIGAAMFTVAALDDKQMHTQVGAVVLSQVAPLLRMSPMNRLRGYLASYLEAWIGSEEFDVRADYQRVRQANGSIAWRHNSEAGRGLKMIDALLAGYPYPDEELKAEEALVQRLGIDFRSARRRSDAIWGHLMEFGQVGDELWRHLDAINGWVKVRSLAQTIHYARHGLLTDAAGRNQSLRQERFGERFGFPLLLLHGQRNRVFDWRGSLDAYELLHRIRRGKGSAETPHETGDTVHWAGSSDLQLHIDKRYGHQDCIVGKDAHRDLFPALLRFLDDGTMTQAPPADDTLPIEFEAPWIGPMLGSLRKHDQHWALRLLAHPSPRRARTIGVVLVPIDRSTQAPLWDLARGTAHALPSQMPSFGGTKYRAIDQTPAMHDRALELVIDARIVPARFDEFIVLAAHTDLPLNAGPLFDTSAVLMGGVLESADPRRWLAGSLPLHADALQDLQDQMAKDPLLADLPRARMRLDARACAAADGSEAGPFTFALASCQYPPGLMDEPVAGASCARLARDCEPTSELRPQFLLAVGDQVYVDATAGVFDPGASGRPGDLVRKAYELNRQLAPFRAVASRLPAYTMLDDHEVRDNWQRRPGESDNDETHAALDAHARWQATLNPDRSLIDGGGLHYAFEPAGALVLVLDTRTQRDARRAGSFDAGVDIAQARIVPDAVLDAACKQLQEAPAWAAKFVVSPAPLLPAERFDPTHPEARLRSDGWSGYPHSLVRLLAFIREHMIQRVVLLSGDAHASAVCTLQLDGDGPTVHAVMSSGLHAPWPFANSRAEGFVLTGPLRFEHAAGPPVSGVMHTHAWSALSGYALLALSAAGDDPHARLRVSLRANDGGSAIDRTLWGDKEG
jgi:cholesterol oxidase